MTDTFDKEKRSWIMARVLSKGTKTGAFAIAGTEGVRAAISDRR